MQRFKILAVMMFVSSFSTTNAAKAADKQLPDEALLEFLASMYEFDGQLSDPLDMLGVTDEDVVSHYEQQVQLIISSKSKSISKQKLMNDNQLPISEIETKAQPEVKLEPETTLLMGENTL